MLLIKSFFQIFNILLIMYIVFKKVLNDLIFFQQNKFM